MPLLASCGHAPEPSSSERISPCLDYPYVMCIHWPACHGPNAVSDHFWLWSVAENLVTYHIILGNISVLALCGACTAPWLGVYSGGTVDMCVV